MLHPRKVAAAAMLPIALFGLGACTTAYTGPVEVTRFIAETPSGLGEGTIRIEFPEELSNERAREAFAQAVISELSALGYEVVSDGETNTQTAAIRTSRGTIENSGVRQSGPVSVGVGGSTGGYGSGVGVGLGINLGGGRARPEIVSELSVRITSAAGDTLWEGRSQIETSVKSAYSDVDASAGALAAGLFRDFPGGNGETTLIDVDELTGTP